MFELKELRSNELLMQEPQGQYGAIKICLAETEGVAIHQGRKHPKTFRWTALELESSK